MIIILDSLPRFMPLIKKEFPAKGRQSMSLLGQKPIIACKIFARKLKVTLGRPAYDSCLLVVFI
jgi:hypothetical protein